MFYEHTQRSPMWLFVAAPLLAVVAVLAMAAEGETAVVVGTGLGVAALIALVAHFSVLTITVDSERASAAFGRGWPRKAVPLDTVAEIRVVRNRWIYGFGIRWIPKGSLWNVWGLDAVEFVLRSGRVVRFGTDDTAGLSAVLAGLTPRQPSEPRFPPAS